MGRDLKEEGKKTFPLSIEGKVFFFPLHPQNRHGEPTMPMKPEFCRTAKHYKLVHAADKLLARSGFFKPAASTEPLEFPNDPTMQAAYDKLVGERIPSDAVSPHGHLRATWAGTIQATDALALAKRG
jgi:hypothetical protein